MSIRENIIKLRKIWDVTQDELGEIAGVTRGAVSQWESGFSEPRMGAIQKMADYFHIRKSNIIEDGGMDLIDPATKKPKPVRLPGAITPSPMNMAYAPLRGSVHAGEWSGTDTLSEELVLIPDWIVDKDPDTYVCKVEGDCMSRVYPEGCLIAVSPNSEPQNGSVAVVSIDYGDAMMRKIYRTAKTLILSPDSYNDEYEDIIITLDDDHVIEFGGKVTWFQPWDEM